MEVLECIQSKRSVRKYKDRKIEEKTIQTLIELGCKASTGCNLQPWGFVIIQNKEEIDQLSRQIKSNLLQNLTKYPHFMQFKSSLENPDYHIFHHANQLLLIYGNRHSHYYREDCTLCAANIMLAAHSMQIGTCWIGFAEYELNTITFKQAHQVPEEFELVCPLTIGYEIGPLAPPQRKAPLIFSQS